MIKIFIYYSNKWPSINITFCIFLMRLFIQFHHKFVIFWMDENKWGSNNLKKSYFMQMLFIVGYFAQVNLFCNFFMPKTVTISSNPDKCFEMTLQNASTITNLFRKCKYFVSSSRNLFNLFYFAKVILEFQA